MREGFSAASGAPPTVHRADYRPPAWLVPEIALAFDLAFGRVRVSARLEVRRNGSHRAPLILDGEGLKLLSLKVDGKPAAQKLDKRSLTIRIAGDSAVVETLVELAPSAAQNGLFVLGETLCTQCEAEGFRRITFFPDRPDILTRFEVTLRADAARFPVLLSNGDREGSGPLDDGRHWVRWRDPYPKPSYLFALVAGDLVANSERFATASGRAVDLAVWVPRGTDLARTGHALASLSAAMRWDEQANGREYDLSAYNIVALPGFAFGAMENKGLPIYDAAQVLVDPATATDAELDSAEALVAHEYLHNWTGNRVTIRDWFEMTLKEGLTVLRDQEFGAAMGSPTVKRIEDARAFVRARSAEDAVVAARPARPETYAEVAQLYNPTVYLTGAEVVRMVRTTVGQEAFRAGMDLFFARHDGGAVTCEEWLAAIAEASGCDLADFASWYAHAGTPVVRAQLRQSGATATLRLAQARPEPPLPIPLRVALIGAAGGAKLAETLVVLRGADEIVFDGIGERALLSLNRGYSAPVRIETDGDSSDLAALARWDDDPFAHHAAMQRLIGQTLAGSDGFAAVTEAIGAALTDPTLEPGLLAELISLPNEAEVSQGIMPVDPARIHAAWRDLRATLGRAFEAEWRRRLRSAPRPDDRSAEAKGLRRQRSIALDYLLASGAADAGRLALAQFESAPTMTERQGALRALADSDAPERLTALAEFHRRHRGDPRLLDAWFSIQALSARPDTIESAPRLLAHPDFTLAHPTRLGAIVGAFAANFHAFHDASGRGYRFLADVLLVLDKMNPAGAARLARAMAGWRQLEPGRRATLRGQLERIAAAGASPPLSAAISAMLL